MTWPQAVHDIGITATWCFSIASCVWAFFYGISR